MLLICLLAVACGKSEVSPDEANTAESERPCGVSKAGHKLFTGPKGGCYYYNGNGNKTYVDRSECNC